MWCIHLDSFVNNLQKIFLICGIINVVVTFLFYVETNSFVYLKSGYNLARTEEQIKRANPGASDRSLRQMKSTELAYPSGQFVKTGYRVHWKTAIPFHLLILSGISFFLFKDK